MGKMIQVSQEAYDRLAAAKRKGESFSEVLLRLTKPKEKRLPLEGLRGLRSDAEVEAAIAWNKKLRALDTPRTDREP